MSHVRVHGEAARQSLRLLQAGIHQAAALALRSAEQAAVESAKSSPRFKDRTGATRQSIRMQTSPGLTGVVSAGGAARFLECGTRPHVIVARGPALRFVVNGTVLYRRWVRHPGTKERPFMREARELAQKTADYGAAFFVEQAIRRLR